MPVFERASRRAQSGAIAALALIALAVGASAQAATWSLQTTQNASGAEHSALYDIACAPSNTRACTAVGRSVTSRVGAPYAQYWNGSTWANQSAGSPVGATDAELQADHCLSTTSCVAVGSYTTASGRFSLAEAWNGTSWSVQTTPNPAGATSTRLRGVSCAVITACIAVGFSGRDAIAERGNSGTWSLQTFTRPAEAIEAELNGVECTSSTSCIAVGRYTLREGTYWALSATWNGTSWTLQTVPTFAGARKSVLLDVSCSDASNCTAVGAYTNSGGVQVSFAARWNGSSWSLQTTPNPAESTNTVLQNVSCAERYSCVAVGDYVNAGRWTPMAQNWNSAVGWSLDSAATRAGATFTVLEGVSCRTVCLAIGWSTDSESRETTIGEIRGNPRWSEKSITNPGSTNGLDGISCVSGPTCLAVGLGGSAAETFIQLEGSWSSLGSPSPAGAVSSELRNVSCTSSLSCIAVGLYRTSAEGPERPYAAKLGGFLEWTTQTISLPVEAVSGALNDVACSSSSSCTAVGSSVNGSSVEQTFVVLWNGTTWTVQSSPNVAGANRNLLVGVSCTEARACTAVGLSYSGTEGPIIERWNGTSWTLQRNPSLPAGGISATLYGVSCRSATACIAAGQYASGGGEFQPYAARWDGTSWTSLTPPLLAFSDYSYFYDVSCASTTNCVAVGTHQGLSGERGGTLAAEWDGTSWTLHDTGSSDGILRGVSCLSTTSCQGVGLAFSTRTVNLALSYP